MNGSGHIPSTKLRSIAKSSQSGDLYKTHIHKFSSPGRCESVSSVQSSYSMEYNVYSDDLLRVFLNAKVRNLFEIIRKAEVRFCSVGEFYGSRVICGLATDSPDITEETILITRRSVCN